MTNTQNAIHNTNRNTGVLERPQTLNTAILTPRQAETQHAQNPTFAYPQNYYLINPASPAQKSLSAQNLYSNTGLQTENSTQSKIVQTPSSGVNIMIFNPSAASPSGSVNNSCNYHIPGYTQQPVQSTTQPAVIPEIKMNNEEKKTEKTYKKEVTELTDNLIKSVENYLRNPNKSIRQQGIKELLSLLKEDPENRKNDVALNNLLNLALQDNDKAVRLLALSALQEGVAQGDEFTTQLLDKISKTQSGDGIEQEMAASAALSRLKNKTNIETKTPPEKQQKEV